jgi:hypothetical protein
MGQHRVDDPTALHQLRQQAEAALQQAPPGVIESPERDPQRLTRRYMSLRRLAI